MAKTLFSSLPWALGATESQSPYPGVGVGPPDDLGKLRTSSSPFQSCTPRILSLKELIQ